MTPRRRTSTVRRTQRKFVWARKRAAQVFTAPGTPLFKVNLLDDFETAYGANLIGVTVTRIRGAVVTDMNAVGNVILAARIGTASEVDAPPTPLSGPFDEEFADWMLWEPFLSAGGEAPGTSAHGRVIDVRSQRKLDEIDEELSLWSSSNVAGTIVWDLSIGLKLP